jgi:hypothetical protein
MLTPALLSLVAALGAGPAHAAETPEDLEFTLDGYYRMRGNVFGSMFAGQQEAGKYMTQRLRLQPTISFQDRAKVVMMADVMDDVVWGDNMSMMPTSVFAQDPSYNGSDGGTADWLGRSRDQVTVKRAWMEFKIPVGLMRVGRQESNWGMGILSNNGNGFDDTFGENHYGSTFDRIIFATRPVAIAQSIAGKDDSNFPFFIAVGVDRLVEDPLNLYYGYSCAKEDGNGDYITEDSDEYDARCDEIDINTGQAGSDGIHDLEHDYVEEGRTPDQRPQDWWVDNDDDAWELVMVAIYKGEDLSWGKSMADFTLGAYGIIRTHDSTNSKIYIADVYTKLQFKGLYFETEVLNIRGKTDGIALRGAYDPNSKQANPLHKEADIWGYATRLGYQQRSYTLMMEHGFASGDENPSDENFTARAMHPDFNVGLLLFEEVMARVSSQTWSEDAFALWTNGGVWNAYYAFPNVRYRPLDNWELIAGFVMAWPHKPDGSRILCAAGETGCTSPTKDLEKHLGWELDMAVKHRFHEHVLFSLEGGYAKTSNRVPVENVGLNPDGKFWTFQSRVAYEF